MQRGAHDGHKEAIVEVVQELVADQGMSNLHHSVAELQRVHEQHERRHAYPVLPPQRVPVISSNLNLPGQGRVESAEARRQHLRRDREASDKSADSHQPQWVRWTKVLDSSQVKMYVSLKYKDF